MKTFIKLSRLFIACLLLAVPLLLHAAVQSELTVYIQRAQQQQLASDPGWLALLHYKTEAILRRYNSQADDPAFFLAENGDIDPAAELEADLTGFLQPQSAGHAQCRFPARWYWLKQQLQLGEHYDVACPRFEQWFNAIEKDSLVMVFPSMYLNNPGSMFGHTFLRFDNASGDVLLSHALNYAAAYDPEDDGVSYIFKGVFGGYRGVFSLRRYFETVQEYSNIQNRDIWEYKIDFTPEEIEQLLRHVWEVTDIGFDYYFFRENCSYRLLGLIDAVRPEAGLTFDDNFLFYTIPVDTIRALDDAGMIIKRWYRPSLASQLLTGFEFMQAEDTAAALALANGKLDVSAFINDVSDEQRAAEVLMLAYTLLQFRQLENTQLANGLLSARSKLPAGYQHKGAQPEPPETGHQSARVTAGAGDRNDAAYIELTLRPGFHDLADAAAGYVAGAEINVLETSLRWSPEIDELKLERLRFFNIVSLNPVRRWYTPLSWQLDLKLDRVQLDPDNNELIFVTRAGAGMSAAWHRAIFFSMAVLESEISRHYIKGYSLLAGLQAGAAIDFGSGQLVLSYEADETISGYESSRDVARLEWQLKLSTNSALRFGYRKTDFSTFDDTDWNGRYMWYF